MSAHYYHICNRGIGRAVEIRTHDGGVHRGIIERVSPNRVFLRPFGGPRRGFGYGGYGYPWGFGFGFATGIALGAIFTLAFIPFFW
ncbi:hypothetical protein ACIQXV_29515 [Neobacillus sp. NPDC097160]|uniref:hypothetical protein n=1 Tax=Neobacillus sp. NPDC097160 TaxID=3364298 RepID=UPI0037FF54EE